MNEYHSWDFWQPHAAIRPHIPPQMASNAIVPSGASVRAFDDIPPEIILMIVELLSGDNKTLRRLAATNQKVRSIVLGFVYNQIATERELIPSDYQELLDEKFGFEFSIDPFCELRVLTHWYLPDPTIRALIAKFSHGTQEAPFLKAVLAFLQDWQKASPIPLLSAIEDKHRADKYRDDSFFDSKMSNYGISIKFCHVHRVWEYIPVRNAKTYLKTNFIETPCCPRTAIAV